MVNFVVYLEIYLENHLEIYLVIYTIILHYKTTYIIFLEIS